MTWFSRGLKTSLKTQTLSGALVRLSTVDTQRPLAGSQSTRTVWPSLRPYENLRIKNPVSSICQRLNRLFPQEIEGSPCRGAAALFSSPGGMTAAVLETLERLPSIKVRCITGWSYESDANLVLTEGPKGRAAPCLVLRITIRMSRKATMARGLAALTSGGTSATAALVRKTGAGWVESAGERLWWYNVVQYGGRGHKSCNWQGLRRPHATPHRSGRATELRGLIA